MWCLRIIFHLSRHSYLINLQTRTHRPYFVFAGTLFFSWQPTLDFKKCAYSNNSFFVGCFCRVCWFSSQNEKARLVNHIRNNNTIPTTIATTKIATKTTTPRDMSNIIPGRKAADNTDTASGVPSLRSTGARSLPPNRKQSNRQVPQEAS